MLKRNLRTVWVYGFLSASLLFSEAALAGIYQLKTELPPQEKAAVLALLDKAESMLPASLKTAVKSIDVKVEPIRIPAPPGSNKRNIIGITKGGAIILSTTSLRNIVAGPANSEQTPRRQHKNAYDEALATVLHESTHVYDELNLHSSEEQRWIHSCRATTAGRDTTQKLLPAPCAAFKGMYRTLSQNPYFLSVAGWVHGRDSNGYDQRSPDIYELKNPEENLAVNMEFFLMDPEFKCRRPSMYRLLRDHFRHEPFSAVTCSNKFGYVMPGRDYERPRMLSIDPSRVYQVHYLLANSGEGMVSGWGHAMIRLVVCAPGKPLGPDCVKDISQSIVLSYRAFVDSVNTNALDGLAGKYPSRLFILPLGQVIDEYARNELRSLMSIPLKLSRKEIENFVVRSVESHWSYDGQYYFISNNCATETFNLIKSAILRPDFMFADIREVATKTDVDNMNPMSLRGLLKKLGLSDESVLNNKSQALSQGYYFDSFEDRYTKVYSRLKNEMNLSIPTFKDYLELKATQRSAVIARLSPTYPNVAQLAAALLLFENASARKVDRSATEEIFKVILEEMKQTKPASGQKQSGTLVKDILQFSKLFARPSNFLRNQSGYGLPDSKELQSANHEIDTKAQAAVDLGAEATGMVDSMIKPVYLQEFEVIKENLKRLRALLGK